MSKFPKIIDLIKNSPILKSLNKEQKTAFISRLKTMSLKDKRNLYKILLQENIEFEGFKSDQRTEALTELSDSISSIVKEAENLSRTNIEKTDQDAAASKQQELLDQLKDL